MSKRCYGNNLVLGTTAHGKKIDPHGESSASPFDFAFAIEGGAIMLIDLRKDDWIAAENLLRLVNDLNGRNRHE